jgi:hypothetical protein
MAFLIWSEKNSGIFFFQKSKYLKNIKIFTKKVRV